MDEFDPRPLLRVLIENEVDFVVIGGLAGIAHGSSYPSYDLDVACNRSSDNLERLAEALRELGAKLRVGGEPADLPFQVDSRSLANGANFTFATPVGSLDVLADPSGAPAYEKLKAGAIEAEISGVRVLVASLDHLIAMKRAAGRTKDKLMETEYIVLAEEQARLARES